MSRGAALKRIGARFVAAVLGAGLPVEACAGACLPDKRCGENCCATDESCSPNGVCVR